MDRKEYMAELENMWADAIESEVAGEKGDHKVYAMATRWFNYAYGNCVLACRKNRDYSGQMSPINSTGLVGIATRIVDKAARLFNISNSRRYNEIENESIADTLRDLSNYGIIGEMAFDEVFDAWNEQ